MLVWEEVVLLKLAGGVYLGGGRRDTGALPRGGFGLLQTRGAKLALSAKRVEKRGRKEAFKVILWAEVTSLFFHAPGNRY